VAGGPFEARERVILWSGVAAAGVFALVLLAWIAGMSLGSFGGKLAVSLVAVYLCARMWGHGKTLDERDDDSILAPIGLAGAMCVLPVLLLQTWFTQSLGLHLSLSDPLPGFVISLWTRVEWSADILVMGLFLLTATAVWIEGTNGLSAVLSRISYVVVGFLTLDLLGCAWGIVSVRPQWRLVLALIVLSFFGTIIVATVRRVERLDESAPAVPPETPEPGAA